MSGTIEAELRLLGFTVGGDIAEAQLDKFAHKVCEYVQDLAAVFGTGRDDRRSAPPEGSPGDFKASIVVEPLKPGHRKVGSDSPIAIWQEIGTAHFPEDAIFAKTAAYFGGTGPIIDESVNAAHHDLRGKVEHLAKLMAEGVTGAKLAHAQAQVAQARIDRSAAFRAARRAGASTFRDPAKPQRARGGRRGRR